MGVLRYIVDYVGAGLFPIMDPKLIEGMNLKMRRPT